MATRFYFNHADSGYTPPAFQGNWDTTVSSTRVCDPVKWHQLTNTNHTESTRSETSSTNPTNGCALRMVSRRLAAQTISGTVDMCASVRESSATMNAFTRLHLYVQCADDDSVLGTLLNQYTESAGGGATEWTTTTTARALQSAQTMTDVTIPNDGNDYRLVVELGYSAENTSTSSLTGGIWFGSRTNNVANIDLTVGDVSLGSSRVGWLEFSGTVALHADVFANVSPETATTLTDLDDDAAFDLEDGGVNYIRWWKYTASTPTVIGWFAWYDEAAGTLRPRSQAFTSTSLVSPTSGSNTSSGIGRSVTIEADTGETVYLAIRPNDFTQFPSAGTVKVRSGTIGVPSQPWILINDDQEGRPAAFVDPSNGDVVAFQVGAYSGEGGDRIGDNFILTDAHNSAGFKIYHGTTGAEVASVAFDVGGGSAGLRANNALGRIVAVSATVSANKNVKQFDASGVEVSSHTLTGVSDIAALSISNSGTYLYHHTGSTADAIKKWDLSGGTAAADLAPGVSGYFPFDVFTLDDESVLVGYSNSSTRHFQVIQYSSAGATLNTWSVGTQAGPTSISITPRLFWHQGEPDHFWVFWHPSDGTHRFDKFSLTSATAIVQRETAEVQGGMYAGTPSADAPVFGTSNSCPMVVMGPSSFIEPVLDGSDPCCEDLSTLGGESFGCASGPVIGAGNYGAMDAPATGTWSNTLNATSGAGGASGSSWSTPDPDVSEDWL